MPKPRPFYFPPGVPYWSRKSGGRRVSIGSEDLPPPPPPPPPPASDLTISMIPSSSLPNTRLLDGRRALLTDTAAGMWISYVVGSSRFAISLQCNSYGVDPVPWTPALAGATHQFAVLGAGSHTRAQVGAAVVAACAALGHTAVVVGNNVRISGASGFLTGAGWNTAGFRGRVGSQRDADDGNNANGLINGTLWCHIPPIGAIGRVRGAGLVGTANLNPRLVVAHGPAYSVNPAAFTSVTDCGRTGPIAGNANAMAVCPVPLAFGAAQDLWLGIIDNNIGQGRFRLHGSAPVLNGNFGVGEATLEEGSRNDPTAVPPATINAPVITNAYGIYMVAYLLIELEPYVGDGFMQFWIGVQRPALGSSPTTAVLFDESAHFRLNAPQYQGIAITRIRQAVGVLGANQDMCAFFYRWRDNAVPAVAGPIDLLSSTGRLFIDTGNAYNVRTVTPMPIGTDVLGANAIVGMGIIGGTVGGGAPTTQQILFDPDSDFGQYFNQTPNPTSAIDTTFSDFVDGFGENGTECRTQQVTGSTFPENTLTPIAPNPFVPSPGDTNPRNIDRHAWEITSLDRFAQVP